MSSACRLVNLFKEYGVGQWKNSSKEGDVSSVMDRDIKSTVYHIAGSIPAANYIQIPKLASQSMELMGQYLYLCFCPIPSKFFVIHLETATSTGLVIRISFSNLFKECKCTSTWLQFPFVPDADSDTNNATVVDRGYAFGRPSMKPTPRWVLLSLDLKATLLRYAVSQYVHLKSVKLCSNMFVKGVYLSSVDYNIPGRGEGHNTSTHVHPLPKEVSYPVPKGELFTDHYDYIRFPEPSNRDNTIGVAKRGHSLPSLSSGDKKVDVKSSTSQLLLADGRMAEAVRTESKPPLVVKGKPPLVVKGKPPLVVKEKKTAGGMVSRRGPPLHAGNKDSEGVSSLPDRRKKTAMLPKEGWGRENEAPGGRPRKDTPAEMERVRKAWGMVPTGDKGGAVQGVSPSVVGNDNEKDTGAVCSHTPHTVGGKADGAERLYHMAVEALSTSSSSSVVGSRIPSLHSLSGGKGRLVGHASSQGVEVHKYADVGAEVSDWNEGARDMGTDGEEWSQEGEEQRQEEEEELRQEEEELIHEEEELRQEEEEELKQEEEEELRQEEEELRQEEEELIHEEEELRQEEEEEELKQEVEVLRHQKEEEQSKMVEERFNGNEVEVKKTDMGPPVGYKRDTKLTEVRGLKGTTHYKAPPPHTLQPDPIMKLSKVMGFGGHISSQVMFSADGCSVIYACHSLIIDMDIETRVQRFFVGHTDKVSCLALNHHGNLLASGQRGPVPMVRVWSVESGQSLALFKTHSHGLFCLSFSHSGGVLCGVGKDTHGKSLVVVWDTSQALRGMAVTVLAKSHTEVGIEKLRISSFDDSRMVSCGWDNIRLWRVKDGSLRSCPVNLEGHHQLHFTDVAFEPGCYSEADLSFKGVYVSTRSGHLLEICCKAIAVKRVWHILGVAITCLSLHEVFCVTGSDDGYVRIWPRDFLSVFMEIEHEAPVTSVSIAQDGMRIIAGTSSGNIGLLDASTHRHCTLMRSHTGLIYCMALSPSLHQLITCSEDGTIRVWDPATCTQLFDFRAPGDVGRCVCYHPHIEVFACGFQEGVVRIFHIPTTTVLAEHRQHRGVMTGVVFSPDGRRLFSATSSGSLAMYDSEQQACPVVRLLANVVVKGEEFGPKVLNLSDDGKCLLFIGPLPFTITVVDTNTLNEILRMDINPLAMPAVHPDVGHPAQVDKARLAFFSQKDHDLIMVITFLSRLLKFKASSGEFLCEATLGCPSTASTISRDGQYLFTAGDNVLKVWDSSMTQGTTNCQVFIGHSEVIPQLEVTADGRSVLSCGDAVFLWDFLATSKPWEPAAEAPPSSSSSALPSLSSLPPSQLNSFMSVSPRKGVPNPAMYEPLVMHDFTPRVADKPGGRRYEDRDVSLTPHETRPQQETTEVFGEPKEEKEEVEEKLKEREEKGHSRSIDKQPVKDAIQVEPLVLQSSPSHTHPPPPSPTLTAPLAQKHFDARYPRTSLSGHLYIAPASQEGMRLRKVLGLNGRGRRNVVWQPTTGLFAYSNGGTVIIEDLSTGQQRLLVGHVGEVSTLAVQHDGCLLASAGISGGVALPCEIRVWKTSSAKCYKVLSYHLGAVVSMAYSRDDRFLVTVGSYHEGLLALWSTHTHTMVCVSALSHTVHEVLWDPTTAYEFATVGPEASLSFWLVEEDQVQAKVQLKLHKPDVPAAVKKHNDRYEEFTSLCFGDKSSLFVASSTGLVSVWDTRENRCLIYWRAEPNEIGIVCSNRGRLVTGSVSSSLQLWQVDCTTSPPVVTMVNSMQLDGAIFSAVFDTKMELGVVGTTSGNIWYISWIDKTSVKIVKGHEVKVSGAAFSEHSSLLATCGHEGALHIWKSDTLEETMLFQVPRKVCTCVAFSPSSSFASTPSSTASEQDPAPLVCAVGYSDGTVRVCSVVSGKVITKLQPHQASVTVIMYSPDGHVILSGCSDGLVAVTSALTGMVVRVISDHQGAPITDLHTTRRMPKIPGKDLPDHTYMWLVASGDRRVSVWNGDWRRDMCCLVDWLTFPGPSVAPNGMKLKRGDKSQYDHLPPSLARFSPTEPDILVYTGYGKETCVHFYSLSQKVVVRKMALTHWATCMDISPRGQLLAFGTQEHVVTLMDYEEGSFQDYTGHVDGVGIMCFSLCGQFLVSSSLSDVYVWEIIL